MIQVDFSTGIVMSDVIKTLNVSPTIRSLLTAANGKKKKAILSPAKYSTDNPHLQINHAKCLTFQQIIDKIVFFDQFPQDRHRNIRPQEHIFYT